MEQKLINAARDSGRPLPGIVMEKPLMNATQEYYYNAFTELSTCRDFGAEIETPIPWIAINDYSIRHNMMEDDFEEFYLIIVSIDRVYLDHRTEKAKQQRQGKKYGSGKH